MIQPSITKSSALNGTTAYHYDGKNAPCERFGLS